MLSNETSIQIQYCRILCIYFMIVVHIPPWLEHAHIPSFFEPIKIFYYDIFGRSSVTAFSCISGFLIYFTIIKRDWLNVIVSRCKSIVVPMAFWNSVTIFFALIILYTLGKPLPASNLVIESSYFEVVVNGIFSLNNKPAAGSLAFLRDLFVCVLLSFPLAALIKRFSWLVLVAAVIVHLTISFQPLVFRGTILVAFITGLTVAYSIGHLKISFFLRLLYVLGLIVVFLIEFSNASQFYLYNEFKRLTLSLFLIDLSYVLTKFRKFKWLLWLAPSTFLVYLTHELVFMMLWGGWVLVFGNEITPQYLAFFFFIPVLWFLLIAITLPLISYFPAFLQVLIKGKVS